MSSLARLRPLCSVRVFSRVWANIMQSVQHIVCPGEYSEEVKYYCRRKVTLMTYVCVYVCIIVMFSVNTVGRSWHKASTNLPRGARESDNNCSCEIVKRVLQYYFYYYSVEWCRLCEFTAVFFFLHHINHCIILDSRYTTSENRSPYCIADVISNDFDSAVSFGLLWTTWTQQVRRPRFWKNPRVEPNYVGEKMFLKLLSFYVISDAGFETTFRQYVRLIKMNDSCTRDNNDILFRLLLLYIYSQKRCSYIIYFVK